MVPFLDCLTCQRGFVVLAAVKHSKNGRLVIFHGEGNYRTASIVRNAQAWPYIVALSAAIREALQTFAIRHNGIDLTGRHSRRSSFCDVLLKAVELLQCLRGELDP